MKRRTRSAPRSMRSRTGIRQAMGETSGEYQRRLIAGGYGGKQIVTAGDRIKIKGDASNKTYKVVSVDEKKKYVTIQHSDGTQEDVSMGLIRSKKKITKVIRERPPYFAGKSAGMFERKRI